MPRKSSLIPIRELAEINYTPLIDLSMLLLVIFLITYPLLEQGIHINLPQANADEIGPQQSRTITIDVRGDIYLDSTPVSLSDLTVEMRALQMTDPSITIFVRADKDIKYGRLIEVMKALRNASISRMALVTQADGVSP